MSSRQDKATTERHTRTLRELVKLPENKVCSDCKRNDPRWASWNIGVFLCIRCSGIHRSMGTHISKVKSVDLDMWTAEQMQSIQKWGNHLANLYWEAHLKAGHVPPEHKIESFIRSKYESRRWAMDGPPPHDPSSLANGHSSPAPAPTNTSNPPPPPRQNVAPPPSRNTQPTSTRQPHVHQLLSSSQRTTEVTNTNKPSANPPSAVEPPQPLQNDLFSLDFNNPVQHDVPAAAAAAPKKDVKNDILSLFSSSTPAAAAGSLWNAPVQQHQPQQQQQQQFGQTTSMAGTQGVGMWGTSSGWNNQPAPQPSNVWGNPAPASAPAPVNDLFGGSNVWGNNNTTASSSNNFAGGASKQDDVFGDIWSGFK